MATCVEIIQERKKYSSNYRRNLLKYQNKINFAVHSLPLWLIMAGTSGWRRWRGGGGRLLPRRPLLRGRVPFHNNLGQLCGYVINDKQC